MIDDNVFVNRPLVSVILVTYNMRKWLPFAIESVLAQSYENWELLVYDDGSTDGTEELRAVWNDDRIRWTRGASNVGASEARRRLIANARGEFVAIHDADDVMLSHRLRDQVSALLADPALSLVGAKAVVFSGWGRLLGVLPVLRNGERPDPGWTGRYMPLAHPTWMGRIEWFRRYPYNSHYRKAQDQELLLRARNEGKYRCLPEPLQGYRRELIGLDKFLKTRWYHGLALWSRALEERSLKLGSASLVQVAKMSFDIGRAVLRRLLGGVYPKIFKYGSSQRLNSNQIDVWTGEWSRLVSRLSQRFGSPRVTVAIPFFNPGNYLHEAVQSVLSQTYDNWDLILIDDGSTDDSVEWCRAIAGGRIRVVSDGVNRGLPYRLNQIAREATGEYLFRMDADDIMHPDRIATQVVALALASSDVVVGAWAWAMRADGTVTSVRGTARDGHGWHARHRFIHPTIAGKTSWFRENPYQEDQRFRRCEDAELWARTSDIIQREIVDNPLLYYREIGVYRHSNYVATALGLHALIDVTTSSWFLRIMRHAIQGAKVRIMGIAHRLGVVDLLIRSRSRALDPVMAQMAGMGLQRIREGKPAISASGVIPSVKVT